MAACGSSSHSSNGGSVTTSAAGGGTTASRGSGGGSTAKGKPLKVVAVTTPITEKDVVAGLKLAEAAVNAQGGIAGHPLDIIMCSDQQSPNNAATCVRNAVSQGAVAEVDRTSSYGASMNPIEQAENIATLGGGLYSEADFTAKNMFPLNSGIMSTIGSSVAAVKLLGAKKIGVPYVNVPAGAALAPTITPLLKPLGVSVVGVVPIAPTAADITPQVAAEVQANPDVVVDGLTLNAYTSLIKGMRQQGSQTKFLASDGVFDQNLITKTFGTSVTGIYQVSEDNRTSPGYTQQFMSDFKKYNVDPTDLTGNVAWAWEAVQLLKTVVEKAGSTSAKDILATVQTLNNFTIGGIVPPVNFTKLSKALGGHAPRLFNGTLYLYQYKNGALAPVGNGQGVDTLG